MIRKLIRNKTILAVASIIMGIYLIIARRTAVYTLVRVIGYALIGIGVAYVLLYLLGKQRRDQVQLGYAGGAIVCGLLVNWLVPAIVNIFPILLGLGLIVIGVSNLSATRDSIYPKAAKAGPIITIVLGALVMFHPGALVNAVVLIGGIALVLNGLSELDLIRRIW